MLTETLDQSTDPVDQNIIPITILTGFLGAGKTTLLNRILSSDHGRRIGVLVNDFGSINIDAQLVVGIEENMISLTNGCVCCEIRDDLVASVEQLISRSDCPEHILLEASGVADPGSIWATFASASQPQSLRLDGVLCVVDCEQIFAHLDEAPDLLMLKARQIGFADLAILNKTDLVTAETLDYVRSWIKAMMDRVRLVEARHCDVPLDVLLGLAGGREDLQPAGQGLSLNSHVHHHQHDHGHRDHRHGDRFATWSYSTEKVFDEDALRDMVRLRLPASIYRCKGFIRVGRDEASVRLLQVVGRRADLVPQARPCSASQIVAIGSADMAPEALRREFEACLRP